MRLYTIQKVGAWETLQRDGLLSPDELIVEQDFLLAYKWMMQQMAVRLPNFSGRYPVWAWITRPDLRTINWSDGPYVMLTIDIPNERVLVSDFGAWHFVLNGWHLSDIEDEVLTREQTALTWVRIFEQGPKNSGWSGELQACVDRIFMSDVIEARPLKRKNWKYKHQCDIIL